MIAGKAMDPVVGVDIHIIQPPGPVPPVPIPHPFIGMIVDPMDFAPVIGATVLVNGMPRATAGTGAKCIPPHIPIGGVFVKPPGNEGDVFMGSATVLADGDPFSRLGDPVLTCHDVGMIAPPRMKKKRKPTSLELPTSVLLAVPAGAPVLVGGPPTINMVALGMKAGMAALGAAMKKLRKLQKGSAKWAAVSQKARNAAKKVMDKLGVPPSVQNRVNRAICTVTGHPVDVATGKVFTECVDFELPGPIPLRWERVWFSTSTYQGPLGHGWHHPYDLRLLVDPEGVVLRLADGRHAVFPVPRDGHPPAYHRQERLTLWRSSDGYVVTTQTGLQYCFASAGAGAGGVADLRLSRVRDLNGNAIAFHYTAGRLTGIVDSAGRELVLLLDPGGRIVQIDGPDPTTPGARAPLVAYGYSGEGDLVWSADPAGAARRFAYENRLLVRETDPAGFSFHFEYARFGEQIRCVRTWGDGGVLERRLSYDLDARLTVVVDTLGAVRTFEWNDLGLVTRAVDPLGHATLSAYDRDGHLVSTTDPLGGVCAYTHDELGRVVAITEADGATTRFAYDPTGALAGVVAPDGATTTRGYDERGNLVRLSAADGSTWQLTVDERGLPVRESTPTGREIRHGWSAHGLVTAVEDQLGQEFAATYDVLGRRTGEVRGGIQRLAYEWDRAGNLLAVEENGRRVRTFAYDSYHDPVAATDALGRTWRYEYGPLGHPVAAEEPDGAVTRWQYDLELRVVAARDPRGRIHRFERDLAGRVVAEVTFEGRRLTYERDAGGRVVARTDARGRRSTWAYDARGRVVRRVDAEGRVTTYAYDAAGRCVRVEGPGGTVEREYSAGRVVRETVNGATVRHEYDAVGNRTARTSPFGRRLAMRYDLRGRLVGVSDERGDVLRIAHDALGREVAREQRGGVRRRRRYGADRRLASSEVARGGSAAPEPVLSREYEYDASGRLVAARDSRLGDFRFSYDAAGHLGSAAHSAGLAESYERDAAGNAPASPAALSPDEVAVVRAAGWELHYDGDGNLLRKLGADARLAFSYDGSGRLARVDVERDRAAAGGARALSLEFEYDPLGRRACKRIVPQGGEPVEIRYQWDGFTLLGERRSGGSGARPAAEREFLIGAESHEPLALFDAEGACTFECDHLGTPRQAFDDRGRLVWEADLTPFGAVRAQPVAEREVPFRLPGQYADAETGLHYNFYRYYDPTLRAYERMDPLGIDGGRNAWNYVPNPLAQIDPFGLIPETDPGHNVYGLYDPPGPPPAAGQKPYYVGITDDLDRRAGEHATSGRLDQTKGGYMSPLAEDVDYGTARGYEQAYIEHHGTRTGTIGEPISATNRGNKVNSFDHDNATRSRTRQQHFESAYEKKMKALKGCG